MPRPAPQDRVAARIARAERREKAVRLAVAGWQYDRIATELGYNSRQAAHRDVKAALAAAVKEQNIAADELRAKELKLLDEALVVAHEIMNTEHLAHGNGRIVRREVEQPDGSVVYEDVYDRGPNLAAADRLIKISESRRKLLGLDAPAKQQIEASGTVGYVVKVSPEEMEQL